MTPRPRTERHAEAEAEAGAEAEAEADALARLYDLDLDEDPGDLDLYVALAARTGGPILELAVGTGRVAIPLAEAGHTVTGVDRDPAMLARARKHAKANGSAVASRLSLIEADLRTVRVEQPGGFRLAFIALNSIFVVGDRRDQARAMESLARHLSHDGMAVVDIWQPDAEQLARYNGRLGVEYVRRDPASGLVVAKSASARHDASGRVLVTSIYNEGRPGEPPRRWIREDLLRLIGPDELIALAEGAGLVVEQLAGDYNLRPYEPGADRAILVASLAHDFSVRCAVDSAAPLGSGGGARWHRWVPARLGLPARRGARKPLL